MPPDIDRYDTERLRAALADGVRDRLPEGKRLLRVVSWCTEGAALLFGPRPGRIAVAYEVALSV